MTGVPIRNSTTWDDYLSPPNAVAAYETCRTRSRSAFARQKTSIQNLIENRDPRVVACLGAGMMNDIPYWSLIEANVEVHLIDWLPEVAEFGVAHAILRNDGETPPQCLYCQAADSELYCLSYRQQRSGDTAQVCDAFQPDNEKQQLCSAFRKGSLPHIHRQDVTGGYADAFGAAVADALGGIDSWRQAFKRGAALAARLKRASHALDIADHSVDLVVSSMVMSQFEHEPYGYFSKQVHDLIGPPSPQEQVRLGPAMEKLRETLLTNQIDGHCTEINRLLAPGGRGFLAFEMFHRESGADGWSLVPEMHRALAQISRHFTFDFEDGPNPVVDPSFENAQGHSVVHHLLLAAK